LIHLTGDNLVAKCWPEYWQIRREPAVQNAWFQLLYIS